MRLRWNCPWGQWRHRRHLGPPDPSGLGRPVGPESRGRKDLSRTRPLALAHLRRQSDPWRQRLQRRQWRPSLLSVPQILRGPGGLALRRSLGFLGFPGCQGCLDCRWAPSALSQRCRPIHYVQSGPWSHQRQLSPRFQQRPWGQWHHRRHLGPPDPSGLGRPVGLESRGRKDLSRTRPLALELPRLPWLLWRQRSQRIQWRPSLLYICPTDPTRPWGPGAPTVPGFPWIPWLPGLP